MVKDVEVLVRVQKAATNLVPHLTKYSYVERLKRLGIPLLERRRSRGDMIETVRTEKLERRHDRHLQQTYW